MAAAKSSQALTAYRSCPCSAFSSNQSARPNVSSARQPRPLLRPPPLEGRLPLQKPPEAIRRTPATAIRSLAEGFASGVRVTEPAGALGMNAPPHSHAGTNCRRALLLFRRRLVDSVSEPAPRENSASGAADKGVLRDVIANPRIFVACTSAKSRVSQSILYRLMWQH
ncbi:hypothetical protein SVAN01_05067 [Stagonosporopsis vannaccii]|nr:hypothetical protein SVAN01_05067 [Stagonosporopsis vannaccii]